jgi:hypothetical protein
MLPAEELFAYVYELIHDLTLAGAIEVPARPGPAGSGARSSSSELFWQPVSPEDDASRWTPPRCRLTTDESQAPLGGPVTSGWSSAGMITRL